MFKKSIAATAAVMLAGGLTFGLAAPSFADDSSQEVTSSQASQVDTQPETSSSTDQSPASEEATSKSSTPETSSVDPSTEANTEESSDDSSQPTESPAPSVSSTPPAPKPQARTLSVSVPAFDGWDTWLISDDGSKTGPVGHVSVGQEDTPQSYLGSGQIAPTCNQYVQQDHYIGTKAQHDALIAAGDLTWTNGHMSDQNYGLNVADWNLVYGGDCPPPIPAAIQCVATGTSYSEDVDWVSTPEGKKLEGQTSAVDHYFGVTGNLQGLTKLEITEATTGSTTQSALLVIEVNPHGPAYPGGPTISYETLSPLGPNADGTTDELGGLWYSSKIPYATAGGQGSPQPMSWFVTNQPNNTLISLGVHYQTQGEGTSIVSGLDADCVHYAKAIAPEQTTTTREVSTDVKDCDAKTVTTTTEHYSTTTEEVFNPTTDSYDAVVDNEVRGEDTTVTRDATEEECPTVVTPPTETPTPTPTPTETTTPAPVALADNSTPTEDVLAHTGSDVDILGIALIALAIAALGGLVVIISRDVRRRRDAK